MSEQMPLRSTIITSARLLVGVILLSAALSAASARADPDGSGGGTPSGGGRDVVRIDTSNGPVTIEVELALDDAAQRRGLMFRREMPADHGMLFVYSPARRIGMWMKNTFLSLDMLFADATGRIVMIAERTEPFSERIITSAGPVYAVLEVNAGTAERLGIRTGDLLRHPLFERND